MVLASLASRLFGVFTTETGSWRGGGARVLRAAKLFFITAYYVNSNQIDLQPAEFIQCIADNSNNNQTNRYQEKKKDNYHFDDTLWRNRSPEALVVNVEPEIHTCIWFWENRNDTAPFRNTLQVSTLELPNNREASYSGPFNLAKDAGGWLDSTIQWLESI